MAFIYIILHIIILLYSIILHEVAHAYAAERCGDFTPREMGRLTLNPLPHIDLFGTIILPLFLLLIRAPVLIGWAKPVPINPYNFRNFRRDLMIVGAAGPLTNIALALFFALLYHTIGYGYFLRNIFAYGTALNFLLAFFNLIPIPPLDGSRILQNFLPIEAREHYMMMERFGFLIIYFILLLGGFRLLWALTGIILRALHIYF